MSEGVLTRGETHKKWPHMSNNTRRVIKSQQHDANGKKDWSA